MGGDAEKLLLGETVLADLNTYFGVVAAIVPGTTLQNATALGALKTAAGILQTSMSAWLAAKGKVT